LGRHLVEFDVFGPDLEENGQESQRVRKSIKSWNQRMETPSGFIQTPFDLKMGRRRSFRDAVWTSHQKKTQRNPSVETASQFP
ncbi:hypothetical protein Tco_0744053, partial [Tanacetum coccineum]